MNYYCLFQAHPCAKICVQSCYHANRAIEGGCSLPALRGCTVPGTQVSKAPAGCCLPCPVLPGMLRRLRSRSLKPRSGSSSNSPSLSGKWARHGAPDPSTAWAGTAQLPLGQSKPRARCPSFFPSQKELELNAHPPDTAHIFYKVCFYIEILSSSVKPFAFWS